MKRYMLAAIAAVVGVGSFAQAATVFNTDVTGGWNPPGNNGQPNGNFKVETVGSGTTLVELGLRAQLRTVGPIADSDLNGVYSAPAGGFGPSAPLFAKWNFDYSVVLGANSGVTRVELKIDTNPSSALTAFTTLFSDVPSTLPGQPFIPQNSLNMGMTFLNLPSFDFNAVGVYDFQLIAFGTGNAVLNSVAIQVEVIPLPLASTAGMALVGMMGLRRRA